MEINPNLSEKAKYDYALILRATEDSDQKAYAELMEKYRDSIFHLCRKMVFNDDDADDLTIETFGKAFQRLNQYTPAFAFSTWLFKIASNTLSAIDPRRSSVAGTPLNANPNSAIFEFEFIFRRPISSTMKPVVS